MMRGIDPMVNDEDIDPTNKRNKFRKQQEVIEYCTRKSEPENHS